MGYKLSAKNGTGYFRRERFIKMSKKCSCENCNCDEIDKIANMNDCIINDCDCKKKKKSLINQ